MKRSSKILPIMKSEHKKTEDFFNVEDDDNLLIGRETHPCVYKGFEKHFQKLFDQEAEILFQNWTVHSSYGHELNSSE